jgi:capsule polysaccharide export protein KpsE/RkpR
MNKETSAAAARRAKETETELVAEPTMSFEHPASAAVPQRASREHSVARMRLLWDNRRLLTRFTATGFVLALATALLIPKQFISTTRLMPPDQGGSIATMAALTGKIEDSVGGLSGVLPLPGMKTTGELFVGVLGSRSVQDDVIQKFDLRKSYGASRWEDARRILAARTTITEDRKSGIITIRVTDRNPRDAAVLAGEYVAALNRIVVDLNTSSAHRERVFLEERLSEVKQSLEAAEHEFSEFSSQNAAIDIKEQGRAMVEAAGRLEGELIAAQTELQGLRQIYTDSNVRVRATQARVNELRRQLPRLVGKTDASTSEGGDLYPAIRKLPLLGVAFADLYRSTRIQETVFETLTKQYELAKVEEAKEVPSVRILDSPDIPERKSFPPRTVITLLGAFTAFLLGIAWVLGGAAWMRWDVQDPRRVLIEDVGRAVFGKFSWASSNGHASTPAWSRILGREKALEDVTDGPERMLSRTDGGEVSSSED